MTSILDTLLTKTQVESYKRNQPILQTVIEIDPLLSLLMKIYEGNLSERDINLHKYLLSYLAKRKLLISDHDQYPYKYYLTDIAKEIIKKIEYELNLLKNINKEEENIIYPLYLPPCHVLLLKIEVIPHIRDIKYQKKERNLLNIF